MSDEATLRDAVVTETKPVTAPTSDATTTTETKPATTVDATADKAAQELGQFLLDSGFTAEQARELPEAARALNAMNGIIETDPREFVRMLRRVNPEAAKKFSWEVAGMFADENEVKDDPANSGKSTAKGTDPDLMAEVKALRETVSGFQTQQQQRDQAQQLALVHGRYTSRVDELMGSDAVKSLNLTRSEQRAMRSDLQTELAKDPATVKRINNGNFVDVPRIFKSIIEGWAGDRKAAADAEKATRDRQLDKSFSEFQVGPGVVSRSDIDKSLEGAGDDWSATERELAAALSRA